MKQQRKSHRLAIPFAVIVLGLVVMPLGLGVGVTIARTILSDNPAPRPVIWANNKPHMQGMMRHVSKPDAVIPQASAGYVPILYRLKTTQPVVFLTIDDGAIKGDDFMNYLKQKHLVASLFLADAFISDNPGYFKTFADNGMPIEDHTLSHNLQFYKQPLAYQQQEICGMADEIHQTYGRRPTLFRPPGGAFTSVTQQAAANCQMRAIVHWHAKVNGGAMQYQDGDGLQPGDIVLMHFRTDFKADVDAFVKELDRQKLHTELLEDWVKA